MWVSLPPVLCLTDVVMDMARKYDAVHKPYATRQSGPDGHPVPPHSAKKHVPCHATVMEEISISWQAIRSPVKCL